MQMSMGLSISQQITQTMTMEQRIIMAPQLVLEQQLWQNMERRADEIPPHLQDLVRELEREFNYTYFSSDRPYLEGVSKISNRRRLIDFLRIQRSVYTFGGVTEKAVAKIGKLFDSEADDKLAFDFATLILGYDASKRINQCNLPRNGDFKQRYTSLEIRLLGSMAASLDIKVPRRAIASQWDLRQLPTLLEVIQKSLYEDNEAEEDPYYEENYPYAVEDMEKLEDVVEHALLGREAFLKFIFDTNNRYGRHNEKVLDEMESHGLNVNSWLNYQERDTFFLDRDHALREYSEGEIVDHGNALLLTVLGSKRQSIQGYWKQETVHKAAGEIKRNLSLGKEDRIVLKTKEDARIALRILKNYDNSYAHALEQKIASEADVSRTKSEIDQILKQLAPNYSKKQGGHVSIELWARDPARDIFASNYIGAYAGHKGNCTRVGEFNQDAIYDYLTDVGFGIVYIKMNNEPIGGAYISAEKDERNQTYLVVDELDIDSQYRFSEPIRKGIRDYLERFRRDVGFSKIAFAPRYMDVDVHHLPTASLHLEKIGGMPSGEDEYYLEVHGGWSNAKGVAEVKIAE